MNRAIVIVGKTLDERVLNYYNNLNLNSKIYVVTPDKEISAFKYQNLLFYNDNFFLKISNSILKTHRPGWYFQQFLAFFAYLFWSFVIFHLLTYSLLYFEGRCNGGKIRLVFVLWLLLQDVYKTTMMMMKRLDFVYMLL